MTKKSKLTYIDGDLKLEVDGKVIPNSMILVPLVLEFNGVDKPLSRLEVPIDMITIEDAEMLAELVRIV